MSRRWGTVLFFYTLLIIGWTCDSYAAPLAGKTIAVDGYVSANYYRKMPSQARLAYVMGVIDGFLSAQLWGANEKDIAHLAACTRGIEADQALIIVDQYVAKNPSIWDESMNLFFVYNALVQACKDRNLPLN